MSINLSSYLGVFGKWTPEQTGIDSYDLIGDDAITSVWDEGDNLPRDSQFLIPNCDSECDIMDDRGHSGFIIFDDIDIPRLKAKFEEQFAKQLYKLREFGPIEILFGSIRYWC